MSTFNSPADVAPVTKALSSYINNLDSATATAFALLPDEDDINNGTVNFGVDAGSANAYVVTMNSSITEFASGLEVSFIPLFSNTSSCTINVNALGIKNIRNTNNAELVPGDLVAGVPVLLKYSSVTGNFHQLSVSSNTAAASNLQHASESSAGIAQIATSAEFLAETDNTKFLTSSKVSAANILTKIKAVDGASSGLDADLLDGQQGAYYAPATAVTAEAILAALLLVDGPGSLLNADFLDGLNSSAFLRADAEASHTSGSFFVHLPDGATGDLGQVDTLQIRQATLGTDSFMTFVVTNGFAFHFGLDGSTNDLFMGGLSLGPVKNKVWHSGNDGPGSGLNADLLDGQSGSYYEAFPTGTRLAFFQASPPTKWTQVLTHNDAMLRVVSSAGGGSGGTDSPILMNKVPSHTHANTLNDPGHNHSYLSYGGAAILQSGANYLGSNAVSANTGTDTTGITITNVANTGASNWTPKYINMIICSYTA